MKNNYLLSGGFLILLFISAACGNKSNQSSSTEAVLQDEKAIETPEESKISVSVQQETRTPLNQSAKPSNAPKFTATQGRGLYGNVKKVSIGKSYITFDKFGNITTGDGNEYQYQSPTRYTIGNSIGPFRIICEENIRKEEDEKGIEGTIEYEFDKLGRVIRYRYFDGMMPITERYQYTENEKHPKSMQIQASYEDGDETSTFIYSYLEFDKQKNWLKRKVQKTVEYTIYNEESNTEARRKTTEPEFIESRTITYY